MNSDGSIEQKIFNEKIEYFVEKACSVFAIDKELILAYGNVKFSKIIYDCFENATYRICALIYGRDCEEIKYPKDWRQAIKENFAPRWFKKKFPVLYEKYILKALIPKHAIRGHKEIFVFMKNYPYWED